MRFIVSLCHAHVFKTEIGCLVLLVVLVATLPLASATGGDEADLLPRHASASGGGGVTHVLVVTTTVGVLHRVHGAATDLGPAVALDAVLVESTASLHDGLVRATATGDDANGGTAGVLQPLLGAGRHADLGALAVDVLRDDRAVVAGAAGHGAAVARAHLSVGDDGTLGHLADRQGVADDQLGLLAAVDELAAVGALDGGREHGVQLVGPGSMELDLGERSATAGVVDDVLHDTLHETDA